MMAQQPQMNMAGMGGPVGGGGAGVPQMNTGTPSNSGGGLSNENMLKKLNTAVYDYLLRNGLYDIAKAFQSKMDIETKTDTKQSPSQRNGQQPNGVDESMDLDSTSNEAIANRPDGLPLPNNVHDGPFLQDWWCQFWEVWQVRSGRNAGRGVTKEYLQAQRQAQQARMGMMTNMDSNNARMRGMNVMPNGLGMQQNDLRKAAAMQQQRGMTPAQQAQMQAQMKSMHTQQMQGNAMERQGSQMDMNGRSSPGSGDNAPSPKRQRLESGNMQQMNQGRPGQPGQMQSNNQVGSLSDASPPNPALLEHTRELFRNKGVDPDGMNPQLLHKISLERTNVQAQSVEIYSQSMGQHMRAAKEDLIRANSNVNKGMPPNMGPGGAQGSPMSQPGMDGATSEFYAANGGRMQLPPNAAAAAQQGTNNNGNHALQDYQMQLMLLEQQNKKRLLMARQEQDSMSHPAGVGPNGQFAPGMSPQGSQRGGAPSPNPNDMQRGMSDVDARYNKCSSANLGQGSPTPGMMDPNQVPPNMRGQMMMGPNGQPMMRPPSSHPMAQGMNPQQQMEMMRQQGLQQMPNGQFAPGQQPGQPMPGQQPTPGGQPIGTPRQPNSTMPPPPAPQANAGGTQPSSPLAQPAPPTPSTTAKAKPGKKEAGKKGAANKKGAAANATPASESEHPPTPTPATPITPMNKQSFNQNQQLPNGAPQAATNPQQQAAQQNAQQNAVQQPAAPTDPSDMGQPFGNLGGDPSFNLDGFNFDGLGTFDGDNLETFDFDTFLNSGDDSGMGGFDANVAFDGDLSIGN